MSRTDQRDQLDAFEAALDVPEPDREAWLNARFSTHPETRDAVRRLLARDAVAGRVLPTQPPEPATFEPAGPPPERVGAYRLTERLGEGGMGVVYRAERDDGLFEHFVAAKLIRGARLDAAASERFAAERRALARLVHPNIVRLLDAGVTPDGTPYILMDAVDGESITDAVIGRDLGPDAIARLIRQICGAVAEAHRRLVAHGDLKPSNVLVTPTGEVRIVDFGVSRLLDAAEVEAPRSPYTAAYASPERIAGEPPSTADDVHALGVLLRELVSRRGPTLGDAATVRPLPVDLNAIAAKAAAADLAVRYGSVDALAEDLDRFLERRPVRARSAGPLYPAHRFVQRRPLASAAGALAAVSLIAVAIVTTALYVRAETERREADRRFADARGMANYMLNDVFDRLSETPGTIALRRAMVDRSRAYLTEMAADPRASPAVRAEAAQGYIRLAAVLGLATQGQLGRRGEGASMLAEAARLLQERPADADSDPVWLHAEGRLGLYRGFDRLAGSDDDADAALVLLRDAERKLARADALDPSNRDVLADLWQVRLWQADALITDGRAQEGLDLLRVDQAAAAERRRRLGDHPKAVTLHAKTEKMMGDAYYALERPADYIAAYREGARLLEAEHARRPPTAVVDLEYVDALWNYGMSIDEQGDHRGALPYLDRALAVARSRYALDPDHDTARRALSLIVTERAGVLSRLGRGREALAESDAEQAARLRRRDAAPDDLVLRRQWLAGLRPAADVAKAAGLTDRACAEYRAAREQYRAFDRTHGLSVVLREVELARIEKEVADGDRR